MDRKGGRTRCEEIGENLGRVGRITAGCCCGPSIASIIIIIVIGFISGSADILLEDDAGRRFVLQQAWAHALCI